LAGVAEDLLLRRFAARRDPDTRCLDQAPAPDADGGHRRHAAYGHRHTTGGRSASYRATGAEGRHAGLGWIDAREHVERRDLALTVGTQRRVDGDVARRLIVG
jgi:hypothetical protein